MVCTAYGTVQHSVLAQLKLVSVDGIASNVYYSIVHMLKQV